MFSLFYNACLQLKNLLTVFLCLFLYGCGSFHPSLRPNYQIERDELLYSFAHNSYTDSWQMKRQNISNTIGDRDYEINFSRTFDSLVVAVSSMELPVKNMER